MKRVRRGTICALALLGALAWQPLWAGRQSQQPAGEQGEQQGASSSQAPVTQAPVTLGGTTLFSVQRIFSFQAPTRAAAISQRIEDLEKETLFNPDSLTVSAGADSDDIIAGDLIIMSVTDQDAAAAGKIRHEMAVEYAKRIGTAISATREERSPSRILENAAYAIALTGALIAVLWLISATFPRLYRKIHSWRGMVIPSLRIQRFEMLAAERISDMAIGLMKLVRLALSLVALYFYASLMLGLFPWTRGYAQILLGYVTAPLKMVVASARAYLPDIFFIIVILVIALYVVKAVHIVFDEIGKETIRIVHFYPEWAEPTFNMVRLLIFALTAVVIFPYLPGSQSPAFRGISIFVGVLFSLGSTSAVANVVSGVILTYMRAFHPGDWVRIAETMGDVMEKNLLVTRLRTIKNEDVTISNAMVLGSQIVNYSTHAREAGLILHTMVTIGYNAPWRKVHSLLIDAALATEHILHEPRPFVWQTALSDFYVHYELNAYTNEPNKMVAIYAELHSHIQDKFNEGGVEIMSPHYSSLRDGNRVTIPDAHLPEDYIAPPFRVGMAGNGGGEASSRTAAKAARSEWKP